MQDLDRALTDISVIRGQLARDTEFQGYGPAAIAATGLLALMVAAAQSYWLPQSASDGVYYIGLWVATAAVSLVVIGTETIQRTRRAHGELAVPMLQSAVEQFLPSIVAGGLLTLALLQVAPQSLWMLPGLWQIVFSLGVFASCRFLPRPMVLVGIWYLGCGLAALVVVPPALRLSPWAMGIPFGVGQLLVARFLIRRRQPADSHVPLDQSR